jgi:hypothetical protein
MPPANRSSRELWFASGRLFRLPMQRMCPAARAVLVELNAARIIAPILLGRVIPFLALGTGKGHDDTNCSFGHGSTSIPGLG